MAKSTKLQDFHRLDAKIVGMEKAIKKASADTRKELRTKPKWKRHRKSRRYNSGWQYGIANKSKSNIVGTVRNRTDWQLTWLLENGHLVTNKKNGIGWARQHPHIHPAFDAHVDSFVEDMRRIKLDVSIK